MANKGPANICTYMCTHLLSAFLPPFMIGISVFGMSVTMGMADYIDRISRGGGCTDRLIITWASEFICKSFRSHFGTLGNQLRIEFKAFWVALVEIWRPQAFQGAPLVPCLESRSTGHVEEKCSKKYGGKHWQSVAQQVSSVHISVWKWCFCLQRAKVCILACGFPRTTVYSLGRLWMRVPALGHRFGTCPRTARIEWPKVALEIW